jgi:thioredoxin-like negative regulator of GroEL
MHVICPACLAANRVAAGRLGDRPVLEEVARQRMDLRVVKLCTEADPVTAGRFGIRSIPTLLLMRRGRELGRMSGAVPAARLLAWVDATLQRAPAEESA